MPRTFLDLTFSASGPVASMVVRRLQSLPGVTFISGGHDLYFDWRTPEEFDRQIRVVHDALSGSGATYRIQTQVEEVPWGNPTPWPPPLVDDPPENPAFARSKGASRVERLD